MLYKNVTLKKPLRLSAWRRVAMGTWKTAADPSVYGLFKVNIRKSLQYLEDLSLKSGQKITITHLIGKALAEAFRQYPQINAIRRLGRIYPRQHIDFFFHIATDAAGQDLSGTVIRNCDQKTVINIARELAERSHKVRKHGDPDYRKSKKTSALLPGWATGWVLKILETVLYVLNLWSPLLGMPRDPFGSAMISNVGSIGTPWALIPLVPYSRVPLLVAIGSIEEEAIVENGQIIAAPVLKFSATFDHRLIDGVVASQMYKKVEEILSDPKAFLAEF